MNRYSIYWKIVRKDENGKEVRDTESCDIIASNFVKAVAWLNNNRTSFNLEFVTSVYTYSDVNIAE